MFALLKIGKAYQKLFLYKSKLLVSLKKRFFKGFLQIENLSILNQTF